MNQYSLGRYARYLFNWHGLDGTGTGKQAREDALERLQGYALPYSDLESRVLPARIADYRFGELDSWCNNGSLGWQGHERLGTSDGIVSIYRTEMSSSLVRIRGLHPGTAYVPLRNQLAEHDFCEFAEISQALGGFPPQIQGFLWDLVWAGEVSNTRLLPLLSLLSQKVRRTRPPAYRRQRVRVGRRPSEVRPGVAGRWYLIAGPRIGTAQPAERDRAIIQQLLARWGVIGQPCLQTEGISGGLSRFKEPLHELEQEGRVQRGEFIAGWGGTQYATLEALDLLEGGDPVDGAWIVAATDPANPFGKMAPWPKPTVARLTPQRVAGARVVLSAEGLIGYLSATGYDLITFDSPVPCARNRISDLIRVLARAARPDQAMLLRSVDGRFTAPQSWTAELKAAGFQASRKGYIHRA